MKRRSFDPFAPAECDSAADQQDEDFCPPFPLPPPKKPQGPSFVDDVRPLPSSCPVGEFEYALKIKHPDGFAFYTSPEGTPPGILLVRWVLLPAVLTGHGLRSPEELIGGPAYCWHLTSEREAEEKLKKLRASDVRRGRKPKIHQRVDGEAFRLFE